jgi:hypothetical protein
MSLASQYKKSLENRWVTRLETSLPDGETYNGVVTQSHRHIVAMRELRDFNFDGVIILPKKIVTGFRDGEFEECTNAIVRESGEIRKAKSPRWLDSCSSIKAVLHSLHARNIWPAVESLFADGTETALYLGPIVETGEQSFKFHCYDAAGKWDQVYELAYAAICRIEIDSLYTNAFNSYMKRKPRK